MAVYLPDLFGAALDGQRQAVSDNYNNMQSERNIIRSDLANQNAELDLMFALDSYGNRVAVNDADTNAILRNDQLGGITQPGRVATATAQSADSTTQADAYFQLGDLTEVYRNAGNANIGARNVAAAQQAAQNDVNMANLANGNYVDAYGMQVKNEQNIPRIENAGQRVQAVNLGNAFNQASLVPELVRNQQNQYQYGVEGNARNLLANTSNEIMQLRDNLLAYQQSLGRYVPGQPEYQTILENMRGIQNRIAVLRAEQNTGQDRLAEAQAALR